jgi:Ca2+-binding RTX toxin-like protein
MTKIVMLGGANDGSGGDFPVNLDGGWFDFLQEMSVAGKSESEISFAYSREGGDPLDIIATGDFIFDMAGYVGSGTLQGLTYEYDDVPVLVATGINVPVTQSLILFNASRDPSRLLQLITTGDDEIWASRHDDTLLGGTGNDTIVSYAGSDSVLGGAGNDDINGNVGDDWVYGEAGEDVVRGGKGNDSVYGGDGDDVHLNGNLGDDHVRGGAGNDALYGGQGSDLLFGEAGNDLLSGDMGADTLTGGAGADWFVLRPGSGADVITDFSALLRDRVAIPTGASYTLRWSPEGYGIIDIGNGDYVTLMGVPQAYKEWIEFY